MRRYFTLDDVKRNIDLLPITEGPFAMEVAAVKMAEFITKVIKKCGWTTPLRDWNDSFSNYIDICWQNYIWPKFYDKAICYTDDDTIADNNFNRNVLNEIETMISTITGPVMASIGAEIAACQAKIEAIRAEEARKAAAAAAAAAASRRKGR